MTPLTYDETIDTIFARLRQAMHAPNAPIPRITRGGAIRLRHAHPPPKKAFPACPLSWLANQAAMKDIYDAMDMLNDITLEAAFPGYDFRALSHVIDASDGVDSLAGDSDVARLRQRLCAALGVRDA